MTPEQSSFLATLVYSPAFNKSSCSGKTLQDLISTGIQNKSVNKNIPMGFSEDQWHSMLNQVQSDPGLADMIVADVSYNVYDGGTMMTLKNTTTHEVAVVYQGTATPAGWKEDFKSGYRITASQQKAIDYANQVAEQYGDSYYITTTGHSKGGNEAALAAVECDGVDKSYAFDAPGNAAAYFEDPYHAQRAQNNSHKVAYYSNENCFVSGTNKRYDAESHWLRSGYDEWAGPKEFEKLQKVLTFSPMAHATIHLYNDDILNGTGTFEDNEVLGPGDHVEAINKFSKFVEEKLPPEDSAYVLDSLGELIEDIMALSGDVSLDDVKEILGDIDPKTIGIMLAMFEEYPESLELFDDILCDGWLDGVFEMFGVTMPECATALAAVYAGGVALSPSLVALLGLTCIVFGGSAVLTILSYKEGATIRLKEWQSGTMSISALVRVFNSRTHDFSDEKLTAIEQLVSQFKQTPIRAIFQTWQSVFGSLPFFRYLNLSFIHSTVASINSLLDSAVDSFLQTIRDKFQQAWSADSESSAALKAQNENVMQATSLLKQLL